MKTTQERINFRNLFLTLSQGRLIKPEDRDFWKAFWKAPESANDIYELISIEDVRVVILQNHVNFCTFVKILAEQIIYTAYDDKFPIKDTSKGEVLNCLRFLTKLMPFLYDMPSYSENLEDNLFWTPNNLSSDRVLLANEDKRKEIGNERVSSEDQPFGAQLLKSLVRLLYIHDFTLEGGKDIKDYESYYDLCLWEPGIGSTEKYKKCNLILESNRHEVLKLIITLCSDTFYALQSTVVSRGSKFLTLLVTGFSRIEIVLIICSFINVLCRGHKILKEYNVSKHNLRATETSYCYISSAVQLLTMMIVYPLPSDNLRFLSDLKLIETSKPYNLARVYIGKITKEEELLFLAVNLISILKIPMENQKEYENSKFGIRRPSFSPSLWTTEIVMLLWEFFQCNKEFRRIVKMNLLHELIAVLLYYVTSYSNHARFRNQGLICSYFILYMSSDLELVSYLIRPLDSGFYEILPPSYMIFPRALTVRDYLITSLCSFCTSDNLDNNNKHASLIVMALYEIVYNLIPALSIEEFQETNDPLRKLNNFNQRGGVSYTTSAAIIQTIQSLSSQTSIQKASNADILALMIRAISIAILKNPRASRMLIIRILKSEKLFDSIYDTISKMKELNSDEIESTGQTLDKEESNEAKGNTLYMDSICSNRSSTSSFNADVDEATFIYTLMNPTIPRRASMNSLFSWDTDEEGKTDDVKAVEESLRPNPPSGMSLKAKEKLPMKSTLKRSWSGKYSLHLLRLHIIPRIKEILKEIRSSKEGKHFDAMELLQKLLSVTADDLVPEIRNELNLDFLPTTPFIPLKFKWSHLSLGWYFSLLSGTIYNSTNSIRHIAGRSNMFQKSLSSTITSFSKLTASLKGYNIVSDATASNDESAFNWIEKASTDNNQWLGTLVKLFSIIPVEDTGIFTNVFLNFNNSQASPRTPSGFHEMAHMSAKRRSDANIGNLGSAASSPSISRTDDIDYTSIRLSSRGSMGSVSSLQSLNTINRSHTDK